MSNYMLGTDVIGEQVVVIRLNDPEATVRAKAGAAGGLAMKFLPQTVSSKLFGEMQTKIASALRSEGVDANVSIVNTPPVSGEAVKSDLWGGVAIGAVGTGVFFGILKIVSALSSRK